MDELDKLHAENMKNWRYRLWYYAYMPSYQLARLRYKLSWRLTIKRLSRRHGRLLRRLAEYDEKQR